LAQQPQSNGSVFIETVNKTKRDPTTFTRETKKPETLMTSYQ
jgi:hypothetical protein